MNKAVQKIVRDVPSHWVGDGFPVRSLFSYRDSGFDPFLLLDYGGPHQFQPSGQRRGVGEHPHRGFETVTIVYQGELEHRDSAGNQGTIGPGDVQWMTAAGGVVHEELHSERFTRAGGPFEMVQLWVNLPARHKLDPPRYQEIRGPQIPVVSAAGGLASVRVIAGEFQAARGPAQTFSPIHLWDLQLEPGAKLELSLPDGFTTILVAQQGELDLSDGQRLGGGELALFARDGERIALSSLDQPARALLLSGQPLGEPVVGQGPFVMNTREQIQQAMLDYQAGRMGRLT